MNLNNIISKLITNFAKRAAGKTESISTMKHNTAMIGILRIIKPNQYALMQDDGSFWIYNKKDGRLKNVVEFK